MSKWFANWCQTVLIPWVLKEARRDQDISYAEYERLRAEADDLKRRLTKSQ